MEGFAFSRIPELIFGAGKFSLLPGILLKQCKNILFVTGKSSFLTTNQAHLLFEKAKQNDFNYHVLQIGHEPSPEDIDEAVERYKSNLPNVVVAIGGGSVIDAGKAISAMLLSPEKTIRYLEVVGDLQPTGEKIPFIAIPTTSGTGSEATKNAVLSCVGSNGYKSSLRHNNYIPDLALIDPELQLTCPSQQTACSGMDAFTQLFESYLSTQANPMTDALALEGISHIVSSLVKVANESPNDIKLRSEMAFAAWLSGITLANAGLGTVHGFASSVGSMFNTPHGVVCGTLMAEVNRFTLKRLLGSEKETFYLKKYATVGKLFTEKEHGSDAYYAHLLVDSLIEMTENLKIPKLAEYGITSADLVTIAAKTSNKNNPVQLHSNDLIEILSRRM
jgi:alcohol dehydrogenase class IV